MFLLTETVFSKDLEYFGVDKNGEERDGISLSGYCKWEKGWFLL